MKELRIGVVMAGGVSLAVWMGGVAAELLLLEQSPDQYGVDRSKFKPVIDVITGTSAGGINGVLLAAALAWGIDAAQFREDVYTTWLELGSVDRLLRSPDAAEAASLFDGDRVLLTALQERIERWQANTKRNRWRDDPGFRLSLTVTTTLLVPEPGGYFDSLGARIVEPKHAATITFGAADFGRSDIARRLAVAARASSAFPVAFEPTFLEVGPAPASKGVAHVDMSDHVRFSGHRWAMDGGVLVNRPLRLAIESVRKQQATTPVKRLLAYIVPDPDPTGGTSPVDQPTDRPSIAKVLFKVAEAGASQSLAEDLEDWRQQQLLARQQRDQRLWVAALKPETRREIATAAYDDFLTQRARVSTSYTVQRLLEQPQVAHDYTNWFELNESLVQGRVGMEWRPEQFPPGGDHLEDCWQWGLRTLRYMAETVGWLMQRAADELGEKPDPSTLDAVNTVARAVDAYYDVNDAFWKWEIDARYSRLSTAGKGDPAAEKKEWAIGAYQRWPRLVPEEGDAATSAAFMTAQNATHDAVGAVLAASDRLDDFVPLPPHVRAGLAKPRTQVTDIGQDDYRLHLAWLADCLAVLYQQWHARLDRKRWWRPRRVGPPSDQGQSYRKLADAIAADTPRGVIWNLLVLWVIQVVTNARITTDDPIELFQISADVPNPLVPRFKNAADKLAGIQAAHFGAFYKRSWRTNDWMWGRLDGAERIAEMTSQLAGGAPDKQSLQGSVLRHELPRLRDEVGRSPEYGGKLHPEAISFTRAVDAARSRGLPDAALVAALDASSIGAERIGGEVGTDQFTLSAAKVAAVAATALHGSGGGLGSLRHLFGQVRNLVVMPFYVLARGVTERSKTATVVSISTFVVAAVLLAVSVLVDSSAVPSLLTATAWVVVVFWLLYAVSTIPYRARVVTGGLALALGVMWLVAAALGVDWVVGEPAAAVALECGDIVPEAVETAPGRYEVRGCDVVAEPASPGSAPADRSSRMRVGVALLGLLAGAAVTAGSLAINLTGRAPTFSAGFAIAALIVAVLLRPDGGGWLVALLTGLVLSAVALVLRLYRRHWWALGMGAIAGTAVAGVAALAVIVGEALPGGLGWLQWPVETAAPWVVRHIGWLLLAAVLLPTVVAVSISQYRGREMAAQPAPRR